MLEHALDYLKRGWSVVPGHTVLEDYTCSCRQPDCDRPGKHPRVRWAEFQTRLPTESEVSYWWRRWPDASIIIITGAISNLGVVDVDPRHGGDEAWREWLQKHPTPETVMALTGGGGVHYLYRHPGREVRNRANMLPGVDFRGDGGYIVAPPSGHSSGRTYEWDASAHPDDMEPIEMPGALVLLVVRSVNEGGEEKRPPLDIEAYVEGREVIPEGARNETMARITGYFAGKVEDYDTLVSIVESLNERVCRPVMEERELVRLMQSIWRRERAKVKAQAVVDGVMPLPDPATINITDPEFDGVAMAAALFKELGVERLTDWYVLQGEALQYVLATPEDEVKFADLLDHESVRHVLLNHLGALSAPVKRGDDRADKRAQLLRRSARPVVVEATKASERISDWVQAYVAKVGVRDVPEAERIDALRMGPLVIEDVLHLNVGQFVRFVEAQFGEQYKVTDMKRYLRRAGWEPAPATNGTIYRKGKTQGDEQMEMAMEGATA